MVSKKISVYSDHFCYSPKDQLKFVLPEKSYHLSKETIESDNTSCNKVEKEYSLLKRYDWECHPIFTKK